jgi:hypothetical protein
MEIEIDPDWLAQVYAGTDNLFLTNLGPRIWAAARSYCPVFGGENSTASEASLAAAGENVTPGALRDSIEFHLSVHNLIVSATGSKERQYAAYVELGHRIVAWGYDTGLHKGAQPFLRPALYTVRGTT